MNRILKIKLAFGLVLCMLSHIGFSQTDCAKNLKKAKKIYEEGNIGQVEELVSGCLEEGFTRDEKVEARKLLVLANLFDDNTENADIHMTEFLKLEPEYGVEKGKDQIEFIKLYETFKTLPTVSIGISAGTNMSIISEYTNEGVHPMSNSESSYQSLFGLNFGVKANKQFTDNLTFELGLNVVSNSFQYNGKYYDNVMLVTGTENQTWFSVPGVVSYSFLKGKVKPYLGVGGTFGYLLGAEGSYDLSYADDAPRPLPSAAAEEGLEENRQRVNYWGTLAVGARAKIPRALVSFDIHYNYNLNQQVISDNRYSNSEVYFNTLYLDNDFYMDNLYFSVSYVYSLYHPKKKKSSLKKTNRKEGTDE